MILRSRVLAAGIVVSAAYSMPCNADQQLTVIGPLFSTDSFPTTAVNGISADGQTVVGFEPIFVPALGHYQDIAFTWKNGTVTQLESLDPDLPSSEALGISLDGSTIVGSGRDLDGNYVAVRWHNGVIENLGSLAPFVGQPTAIARAVAASGDGSVVVGTSRNADGISQAFRWQGGTMSALDFLPGSVGVYGGNALAISQDGTIIVGQSSDQLFGGQAVRWDNGQISQIDSSAEFIGSVASAISADGSVIAGTGYTNDGFNTEAFIWTAGSIVHLGSLGAMDTAAAAISADGTVVVGTATGFPNHTGFRWSEVSGMQSIADWLGPSVDLTGMTISNATGTSADGSVVIGQVRIGDRTDGYIARAGGLTTPAAIYESFANTAQVGRNVSGSLLEQAESQDCTVFGANGTCVFANFSGAWSNGDGSAPTGSVGLAIRLGELGRLGASVGYSIQRDELAFSGSSKASAPIFGLFAGYGDKAESGVRVRGDLAYGDFDVSLNRGYQNGAGTASSHGDPRISALSGYAEAGYNFNAGADLLAGPFVGLGWTAMKQDAFSESGGPFPTSFDERSDKTATSKLGVSASIALGETLALNGTAAWEHRLSNDPDPVSGHVTGVMDLTAAAMLGSSDWAEVSADVSWRMTPTTKLYAAVTADFGNATPTAGVTAGVELGF